MPSVNESGSLGNVRVTSLDPSPSSGSPTSPKSPRKLVIKLKKQTSNKTQKIEKSDTNSVMTTEDGHDRQQDVQGSGSFYQAQPFSPLDSPSTGELTSIEKAELRFFGFTEERLSYEDLLETALLRGPSWVRKDHLAETANESQKRSNKSKAARVVQTAKKRSTKLLPTFMKSKPKFALLSGVLPKSPKTKTAKTTSTPCIRDADNASKQCDSEHSYASSRSQPFSVESLVKFITGATSATPRGTKTNKNGDKGPQNSCLMPQPNTSSVPISRRSDPLDTYITDYDHFRITSLEEETSEEEDENAEQTIRGYLENALWETLGVVEDETHSDDPHEEEDPDASTMFPERRIPRSCAGPLTKSTSKSLNDTSRCPEPLHSHPEDLEFLIGPMDRYSEGTSELMREEEDTERILTVEEDL